MSDGSYGSTPVHNVVQEHYEAFKMLQPAVEAAGQGLGQTFYLPWEFAHAMRAAVQAVLREHVLPRLVQQASPLLCHPSLHCIAHRVLPHWVLAVACTTTRDSSCCQCVMHWSTMITLSAMHVCVQ